MRREGNCYLNVLHIERGERGGTGLGVGSAQWGRTGIITIDLSDHCDHDHVIRDIISDVE